MARIPRCGALTWREKYPDVPVTESAAAGSPVPILLRAASGAGLLVVGRQMRERPGSGPQTGPVTQAAIHHARCPVAVVPHG
ncbi:universal stress protein [Streptomyces sp. NBC_00191]|uniref:universal stress protein n=1 Tax=Streptomyces sp. NBC_00191 TaxID=2975674 RepID=UPI00386C222E